jgi:hypothetical protein
MTQRRSAGELTKTVEAIPPIQRYALAIVGIVVALGSAFAIGFVAIAREGTPKTVYFVLGGVFVVGVFLGSPRLMGALFKIIPLPSALKRGGGGSSASQ